MMTDRDQFLEYCSATATDTTLYKIQNKLDYILSELPDRSLSQEDVIKFLAKLNKKDWAISTKNDTKKILKRFLRWKYKDHSSRFDFNVMRCNGNDSRKLAKSDLLTPDEMQIILKAIDSLKYKTLLLLFQETACRPEEILKLTWKDVSFDKGEIKLHSAKTDKTRYIPINQSLDHLKRYKTECFYIPPKANERVFSMRKQAVQEYLDRVERRIKFKKHLYPYLWRHSILSGMIKTLSPKVYEMYAGHSLATGMKVYAHLDNEDLREELKKVGKISELTKEKQHELEQQIQNLKNNFKKFIELIAVDYETAKKKKELIMLKDLIDKNP